MNFSIIIPTHTGQEYLPQCLDSIIGQETSAVEQLSYEVVLVIDGQNEDIDNIVEVYSPRFKDRHIRLVVFKFRHNQGRFLARKKGAEIAAYDRLLFVDDRVILDKNFLSTVSKIKEATIPSVVESHHPNMLSRYLFLIRIKLYGKSNLGKSFDSTFIDKSNFDKMPKGTAGLWIKKTLFLDACRKFEKSTNSLKTSSDDTRLLGYVVEKEGRILRTSDLVIYYHPRSSFWDELDHIRRRGPLFVDYYLRPGTRFWRPLVGAISIFLLSIIFIAVEPKFLVLVAMVLLIVDIVLALVLIQKPTDLVLAIVMTPLVVVAFGIGITHGIAKKLRWGG